MGVITDPEIRPFLGKDALEYAAGAYSGPTNPSHRNSTYAEIAHPRYSAEVKAELKKFIARHKIKEMTAAQMETFAGLVERGLGANGKENRIIGEFNRAIKGMVPTGAQRPSKMDEVLAAGRRQLKHPRFRLLAAAAVVSGILGEAVSAQAQILDVAIKSDYYRRAVGQLKQGNLTNARNLLIGDDQSLYTEIQGRVGFYAAENFKKRMQGVFDYAQKQ